MSIAVWKTVLNLAKLGAVLILAASAFFFWQFRGEMQGTWSAPDFSPPLQVLGSVVGETKDLMLPLGRFQKERPKTAAPVVEKTPDIETALGKLGEIIGAIVIYPPYEEGGFLPAIIFKWKQRPPGAEGDVRTIRLGEALVERFDTRTKQYSFPEKYQFIRCERDPENPAFTYFVFDMKCDGTDIQKVHWKLDEPAKDQNTAEGPASEPGPLVTDKMYVGPRLKALPVETPPAPDTPVAPQPPEEKQVKVVQEQPSGSIFDQEEGVYVPTDSGIDYLQRNYEEILKGTRTDSYRGGVRIIGIGDQSIASQFGIRKDDVILRINDQPVASQSEAVDIVKRELKKRPAVYIIKVVVLRAGREITMQFDTRDPATRRMAKGLRR
jgi:hypothetical protein